MKLLSPTQKFLVTFREPMNSIPRRGSLILTPILPAGSGRESEEKVEAPALEDTPRI